MGAAFPSRLRCIELDRENSLSIAVTTLEVTITENYEFGRKYLYGVYNRPSDPSIAPFCSGLLRLLVCPNPTTSGRLPGRSDVAHRGGRLLYQRYL